MAIGTQDNDEVMSEINMIPFIDVMLVLLIIFIITVPVIKHAVHVDLPQASAQPIEDQPEHIRLTIDAEGTYFWNDERVSDLEYTHRLGQSTTTSSSAALQIRADQTVRYERVAQAMAVAQRLGVTKMGFVTSPQ
jgi:biopolymer transport protein ExbD